MFRDFKDRNQVFSGMFCRFPTQVALCRADKPRQWEGSWCRVPTSALSASVRPWDAPSRRKTIACRNGQPVVSAFDANQGRLMIAAQGLLYGVMIRGAVAAQRAIQDKVGNRVAGRDRRNSGTDDAAERGAARRPGRSVGLSGSWPIHLVLHVVVGTWRVPIRVGFNLI